MAHDAVVQTVLRMALHDPGKYAKREEIGGCLELGFHWQVRAIEAALERAGLSVVFSSELRRTNEDLDRLRKLVSEFRKVTDADG